MTQWSPPSLMRICFILLLRSRDQGKRLSKIAKAEGINFSDVVALRLDFKNILKVDNLWEFSSLTKLQLDNNIIERIEGLDALVNLVWCDLSFNNIEVIEGLDSLINLQDLTLYNNRISRIENMDGLKNLQVFSIGNNDLKDLENLIYLRRFKKLKTLNVGGNPFCELEDYKQYVHAFLSNLDFLDYRLIDEQTRTAAMDRYQISIEEMLHNERQAEIKQEEDDRKRKEFQLHKDAYVENMNGIHLFEMMYAEDIEGQKLNEMPGIEDLLLTYPLLHSKKSLLAYANRCLMLGSVSMVNVRRKIKQFWECVEEAKKENKELGMRSIADFMSMKKKLFQELSQIGDQKMLEKKATEYNTELTELWDRLMGLELQLVDQLEEAIKDFERNMQDMVTNFTENIQGFLSQCRDLENQHHEKLLEVSIVTLEKVIKNELDEEITEDLRMLFVDKDTIINAVTSSHDVHLLKIDNKEDDMVTRINHWIQNLIEKIHKDEEIDRNRMRISEINHTVDHLREELDSLDIIQGSNY
ncbi:hypothetical protein ScPMuIL_004357 [Solemya velum]